MGNLGDSNTETLTPKVVVLRWGHRPQRDARLTTHVALTARALGAEKIILADVEDSKIEETIGRFTRRWGGSFSIEMGTAWRKAVNHWKSDNGVVVHLTAYGENIETSKVLKKIEDSGRNIMVIVGSQKVPSEFFSKDISDFNVAVGNQPHSECASLAVFLDRILHGKPMKRDFRNAQIKIIPQKRGKKTRKSTDSFGV